MFGAEGNPGPVERVIRRSEDSNADPRTDEVARTGVVHVPAARQGGCNTPPASCSFFALLLLQIKFVTFERLYVRN